MEMSDRKLSKSPLGKYLTPYVVSFSQKNTITMAKAWLYPDSSFIRYAEWLKLKDTSGSCLVQLPCSEQGQLEVAQGYEQLGFEYLWGGSFQRLSGQSISISEHSLQPVGL